MAAGRSMTLPSSEQTYFQACSDVRCMKCNTHALLCFMLDIAFKLRRSRGASGAANMGAWCISSLAGYSTCK